MSSGKLGLASLLVCTRHFALPNICTIVLRRFNTIERLDFIPSHQQTKKKNWTQLSRPPPVLISTCSFLHIIRNPSSAAQGKGEAHYSHLSVRKMNP
ncbi:hypothetical protein CPB84DRAFT_1761202 [Gymnopilus junonius]|uniref:Uncharacterized protein n=1 Tax=Gymnopilus junonius TaxID=109634 RepID=A0A9P5P112_GYMJU|nr:hypothetical protein CPB84DRAFT_1761202 [Gymnopilus junonius]